MFRAVAAQVEARIHLMRKAVSFAFIGVLNVSIDAAIFFLIYSYVSPTSIALRLFGAFVELCKCSSLSSLALVFANIMGWLVAVSFSYIMNTKITFAAESGGRLRWRDYGTFVASGLLGVITNTAVLVIAAKFIPVLAAKGCAIFVAFFVNFSMSHFVVFRARSNVGR